MNYCWFRRIPYVYDLEQWLRNVETKRRLSAELATYPQEGYGPPKEALGALGDHRLGSPS